MKQIVINRRNTERWKSDVNQSVLFYNEWFLNFAPATYVKARKDAIAKVEIAFSKTDAFRRLTANVLEDAPETLAILRMATTPPLARDRLSGLSGMPKTIIKSLEDGNRIMQTDALERIVSIVSRLLDKDIMPWLERGTGPEDHESAIASAIIGDRVCGSLADPLIRNEQEKRRKEEAVKNEQLKKTYGSSATLLLFLCGYFDSGYLGYEAAEGIDWVWEHRINDLEKAGV